VLLLVRIGRISERRSAPPRNAQKPTARSRRATETALHRTRLPVSRHKIFAKDLFRNCPRQAAPCLAACEGFAIARIAMVFNKLQK